MQVTQKLPDDAVSESPIPCDFKIGDEVVFTNDAGVKFDLTVLGFAAEPVYPLNVHPELYSEPRFIYVFTDAWWFPVAASRLTKRTFPKGVGAW